MSAQKHSAIADILWQIHDGLIEKADWWTTTEDDPHNIATSTAIALREHAAVMRDMLEKNYYRRRKP